ncbi:hypothetical protein F5880DRAFT_1505947, partial [Lentinula raphanica]
MSATNALPSIQYFAENRQLDNVGNFLSFSDSIISLARGYGLEGYLDGSIPRPNANSAPALMAAGPNPGVGDLASFQFRLLTIPQLLVLTNGNFVTIALRQSSSLIVDLAFDKFIFDVFSHILGQCSVRVLWLGRMATEGENGAFQIEGVGVIEFNVRNSNGTIRRLRTAALYTPTFSMNLLSIPSFDAKGYIGSWGRGVLSVKDPKSGDVIIDGKLAQEKGSHKLYQVDIIQSSESSPSSHPSQSALAT